MKKIMLLLLFVPMIGFCQVCDSIKMTKIDYPAVVVNIPSKNNSEIYTRIKAWINRTYKNPDIVIKADELNNYIRITAIDSYTFAYMGTTTNKLNYDLEINIKDNKYKFQYFNVKSPDMNEMPKVFFDDKGEIRGIKKLNLRMQNAVLFTLNSIHFDLYNFINKEKSDW